MRKLLLFFFALLTSVSGVWATTTITVGPSSGTYHKGWDSGAISDWGAYWKSTAKTTSTPSDLLRFNGNGGGMNATNGDIYSNQTYTLTAATGWVITSYTFNGTAKGADITITPSGGSGTVVTSGNNLGTALSVNVNANSTTFTLASSGEAHFEDLSLNVTLTNSSSDIVAGKSFTLQCKRGYVYYDTSNSILKGTADQASASVFAFVEYEGNTYLYDATQSKFVCHSTAARAGGSGNQALESDNDFSKIAKGFTLGSTGISTYPYYVEETQFGNWLNMDGTPKVYLNTWTNFESGNGGNTYAIEIVDNSFDDAAAIALLDDYFHPSSTVTYVISDASGIIYTTEAVPATIGATITSLPSEYQRPYCTYNVTSTTVAAGNNNVTVLATYNPPFTVSSNFASATWYFATLRGKQLRADESAKDGNGRYQTNTTNERTDVYKWAFVGNPYNLSIMNKGAGDSKVLYAGDVPVMQAATPASDNKARWIVSANGDGFSVRSESGANLYINDAGNGGNLGYWNSSWGATDAGSCWVVTEVPVGEDEFNAIIAELEVINWGLTASGNKGKPNYYNFIGTYAGYAGNEMNSIKSLESAGYSTENLAAAQDILANGYALNMPAAGFYRVKGKTNNKYLAAGNASNGKYNMSEATDNTTLFYFNGSKLMNVSSGLSNGMTTASWQWVTEAAASTVSFEDGQRNGGYLLHSANAYFFDNGTSADRGNSYDNRDNYRNWYLEPFDGPLAITIGDAKYATLYAPVALTIPANVQAYYVSELTETEATLTEVSTTIAANTPVILKAAAAGAYNFAFTTGGTDVSASNQLSGSVGGVAVADDEAYTLQQNEAGDAVGLFPKAAGTIAGFKAYLSADKLPAGVRGLAFTFEGADGINTIEENTVDNGAIFNLSGQRVQKAQKGLYIVNGKKFIIK